MNRDSARPKPRESLAARAAAVLVAALCLAALAWLNRDAILATGGRPAPALNPDFVACREARTGQVERMRAEGVINDAQFAQFKARAEETCAGQFPPSASAPAPPR